MAILKFGEIKKDEDFSKGAFLANVSPNKGEMQAADRTS